MFVSHILDRIKYQSKYQSSYMSSVHYDLPPFNVSSSMGFFCTIPHCYETCISIHTNYGSCLPTSSVTVSSLRAFIPNAAIKPTPPFRSNASSVLRHQEKEKKDAHKRNHNKQDNTNRISESSAHLCSQWLGTVINIKTSIQSPCISKMQVLLTDV